MDNSDECIDDAFSDKFEMIKSGFLRHCVWITAVLSVFANSIVLFQHFKKIRKIVGKKSSVYCNTLLLTNLAFSDMSREFHY